MFCSILYLFIAIDIVNGAGRVPDIFLKLNTVFLALYCIILFGMFLLMYRSKLDKIQCFVLWMMIWQFLIAFIMQNEISLNMIYQISGWPLLFLIIYQSTKEGIFQLPTLKYVSLLWILASIYVVYVLRTYMWNDIYRIYYLIVAVPFYICLKDKWKYSRLALTMILIIFSYKRTAFMAMIIGLVAYFLCDIYIQKNEIKKYFKVIIIFVSMIIVAVLLNQYGDSLVVVRRLQNIANDNGSDRFMIWNTLWNYFKNENVIYKLIGNGYHGCLIILNYKFAAAHNDFIEILIDYGLVGLVNHLIFIFIIGKNLIKNLKLKTLNASGFTYMFVVWIVLMMFSFITWQSILMKPVAMYFAYMLAESKYNKKS